MKLWDFALAAWERPGVSDACLALQDQDGQSVPLLLWRAWALDEGRGIGGDVERHAIRSGAAVGRRWSSRHCAPRAGPSPTSNRGAGRNGRRGKAELDAERTLIERLEAITPPPSGKRGDLAAALIEVTESWNGSAARAAANSLAVALR